LTEQTANRRDDAAARPVTLAQLFIGMALFGSATPLSKIIGEAFPVFTASLMRMGIAALTLAPFVWPRRGELIAATRRDWLVICLIALAGMVGCTATMLYGMRLTTGVIGATIMSATPALTAVASVVFLGAALNARKITALALAVAGALVVNLFRSGGEGGGAVVLGALLVAVAICFEAAYTLLSKGLSDDVSSLSATFAASLLAAPAFLTLAFLFDPHPFDLSGADSRAWGAVAFWGAGTGGLAPVLWYNGVRRAPGPLAAGFMGVMPVTALALSYLLLGESFRWAHLIGFGLAFAGVILMTIEHRDAAREKARSENSPG